MEPVELVQIYIYQINTYRKDLSWLQFDNEPRVQERQQVKDQRSCIRNRNYVTIEINQGLIIKGFLLTIRYLILAMCFVYNYTHCQAISPTIFL